MIEQVCHCGHAIVEHYMRGSGACGHGWTDTGKGCPCTGYLERNTQREAEPPGGK